MSNENAPYPPSIQRIIDKAAAGKPLRYRRPGHDEPAPSHQWKDGANSK